MNQRRAFLDALLPSHEGAGAYVVGRNRPPHEGNGAGRWGQAALSTIDEVEAWLEAEAQRGEVYVALAAFMPGRGRLKEAVIAKSWISADIDDKVMPGETAEERHSNSLKLANTVPVPKILIDSGGGFHVHVCLPQGDRVQDFAEPAEGIAHVERLAVALRRLLNAQAAEMFGVEIELDPTHTADRVWRVPASLNCKARDGEKPLTADRDLWRPVKLVGPPGALRDVRPADISFLAPYIGGSAPSDAMGPEHAHDAREHFEVALLPERLREGWPLGDGNQSQNDYAVCLALAEAGHEAETLVTAIMVRRALLADPADRAKGRRLDYTWRTAARALRAALSPHTPLGARDTRTQFSLITAAAFVESVEEEIECVWDGVIPRGAVVVVSGPPKVGKTTILFHFVRRCVTQRAGGSGGECDAHTQGQFLGRDVRRARVAWLGLEEPPALFKARLKELGLADAEELFVLPVGVLPTVEDIPALEAAIEDLGIDMVIGDPLIDFFQVENENDAPEIAAALRGVRLTMRRTGCTFVFVHHDRKNEGVGVQLVRGSSAIAGAADVVVLVSAPHDLRNPHRHVDVRGRYGLGDLDAVLQDGEYTLLDQEELARRRDEEKGARREAREAKKAQKRDELVRRTAEYVAAHPEGVNRAGAIEELRLPANRAKAVLDAAVERIEGHREDGRGNRPMLWFPPAAETGVPETGKQP